MTERSNEQFTCANIDKIVDGNPTSCTNHAEIVCKGCFLVQYCSQVCQHQHWPIHKDDCTSPLNKSTWRPQYDTKGRRPAFMDGSRTLDIALKAIHGIQKYLWGNVPAIDILNYPKNEGVNMPQELHLLFAASGDCRNIIKTLLGLPDTYNGKCEVVINDNDFDVVARNIILLLTALIFDPIEAADIMLHVWYSAFITESVMNSLQNRVLPLFEEVCGKIQGRSEDSPHHKTWTFKNQTVELVLPKRSWDRLPSYLKVRDGLTKTEAQALMMETTLALSRRDYLELEFFNRRPARRVCATKFRIDGILLPFGHSRTEFIVPNPTLFQSVDCWPIMDSAEPIKGWSVKEVTSVTQLARSDINGSLYYYLKELFRSFCRRVGDLQIRFQFFALNAIDLPQSMAERGISNHYFDRIELANLGDRGYLGPEKILTTFSPLLKRKTQNPHATLLGLFLNAVYECTTPEDESMFRRTESQQLKDYMLESTGCPVMVAYSTSISAESLRFRSSLKLFRNFDLLFDRFMKECSLHQLSEATGLKIKESNTLVKKWPLRFAPGSSQKEFDEMLASGHIGYERYVEWESMN